MKMKHIKQNIENNKFLANPKYHKNNYWSVAHFESWAVQGKAGGCTCCKKTRHYNATLYNKRATNGGKNKWGELSGRYCNECMVNIEKELGTKFKRDYCP
jgi:hypothetical protein